MASTAPNVVHPRLFVTGSTGQLGRLVVDELLKRVPAASIVAGVRSVDHDIARQFTARGVEVRVADYARPDTLATAFGGIDRLLLISSSELRDRTAQHANVIDAAKAAGVGLLAYTSLLHADTSSLTLGEDHRQTEALLSASGIPSVLLRNGWYMENHMASIASALEDGAVIGSADHGRFSTATRADFAEAAAVVLTTDGHQRRIYELAGDESYTLPDLAAAITAAAGKSVVYTDLPKADLKHSLIGAGLPEPVAELIADSDEGAAKGDLEENGRQLSKLIGRPTVPLWSAVKAALSAS